jgi:hypothetical protein
MRAIPSTLYYYVEFLHEGQVYVIPGDTDPLSHCLARPYITSRDEYSLIPSFTPPDTEPIRLVAISQWILQNIHLYLIWTLFGPRPG